MTTMFAAGEHMGAPRSLIAPLIIAYDMLLLVRKVPASTGQAPHLPLGVLSDQQDWRDGLYKVLAELGLDFFTTARIDTEVCDVGMCVQHPDTVKIQCVVVPLSASDFLEFHYRRHESGTHRNYEVAWVHGPLDPWFQQMVEGVAALSPRLCQELGDVLVRAVWKQCLVWDPGLIGVQTCANHQRGGHRENVR